MNARPPLPSTFFEGKDRRKRGVFLNFFSSRRNVDKRPASRKFSRVLRLESLEENRHNIGIIILSDRWQRFHERRGTWKRFEGWLAVSSRPCNPSSSFSRTLGPLTLRISVSFPSYSHHWPTSEYLPIRTASFPLLFPDKSLQLSRTMLFPMNAWRFRPRFSHLIISR